MDAAEANGVAEARGDAEHMKGQDQYSDDSIDYGGSSAGVDLEASGVGEEGGALAARSDDAKVPTTKEAKPIRSREYCVTLQMFSTDHEGAVHGDIMIYGASKLIP